MAMTIGFLGPCGMNTPHTHPRATEMLYVVNGTLSSGMIAENGARFVFNTLEAGSAMLFPKGSIHFQQNEGCGECMFYACFWFIMLIIICIPPTSRTDDVCCCTQPRGPWGRVDRAALYVTDSPSSQNRS